MVIAPVQIAQSRHPEYVNRPGLDLPAAQPPASAVLHPLRCPRRLPDQKWLRRTAAGGAALVLLGLLLLLLAAAPPPRSPAPCRSRRIPGRQATTAAATASSAFRAGAACACLFTWGCVRSVGALTDHNALALQQTNWRRAPNEQKASRWKSSTDTVRPRECADSAAFALAGPKTSRGIEIGGLDANSQTPIRSQTPTDSGQPVQSRDLRAPLPFLDPPSIFRGACSIFRARASSFRIRRSTCPRPPRPCPCSSSAPPPFSSWPPTPAWPSSSLLLSPFAAAVRPEDQHRLFRWRRRGSSSPATRS